jgi:uncharacterized membrane protein
MARTHTHPDAHVLPAPPAPLSGGEPTHMQMHDDKPAAGAPMEHRSPPWPHFANMVVGLWPTTSIFALEYRSTALQVSDAVSGVLVIVLSILSLSHRPWLKLWAPWTNSLVGLWLLFAPLIFWSPTSAVYTNDTLVGTLVIVFAILVAMPGMRMLPGPNVPRGWSYNPSSWPQRTPIIALALVGFFLSRQMTSFQLHYVTSFTDPFFGVGTVRVLTSKVSHAFPIPDAGLGAVAYMIEFLMGFMGDKARWRTMPWMVTFFGILVVPLGVVSITLIILQPLAVGAWCTPCLIAASAMLVMISLTLDEVVAMLQFLVQARQEGQPLWKVFWSGGVLRETSEAAAGTIRPDAVRPMAMFWGVSLPWNLVVSAALGLWLMFAPSTLGISGTAARSDHLVGALMLTVAVIALAEVGRAARFVNALFGAWVIASPWLLRGTTSTAAWNDMIVGTLVILLSFPRGPVVERYGSFERYIR